MIRSTRSFGLIGLFSLLSTMAGVDIFTVDTEKTGRAHTGSTRYRWQLTDHKVKTGSALSMSFIPESGAFLIGSYDNGRLYAYDTTFNRKAELIFNTQGGISAIEPIRLGEGPGLVVSDEFTGVVLVMDLITKRVVQEIQGFEAVTDITVADFNGDGMDDFMIADAAGLLSQWYRGSDDQTFESMPLTEKYALVSALHATDFDFDGDMDVIIASEQSGQIEVLMNTGAGLVSAARLPRVPGVLEAKDLDVDLDGDTDLVVVSHLEKQVLLLRNNNGRFEPEKISTKIREANAVTIVDLNGDGRKDLLVTGFMENHIRIIENRPGGFAEGKIKGDIIGATGILPLPDGKSNTQRLLITSFDLKTLFELSLIAELK